MSSNLDRETTSFSIEKEDVTGSLPNSSNVGAPIGVWEFIISFINKGNSLTALND